MTEEELVQLLREQNSEALDYFRLHYGPLIRYLISPILPDVRDREEVFSDIQLRIWDKIRDFDPQRASFRTWLTALVRNAAIDRARRSHPQEEALTDTIPAPDSDPLEILWKEHQKQALKSAFNSLPQADRTLFYRKYYYRQSTAQIAGELGTSQRAIEGRLYRIRQKLRKKLGGEYHG